MGLAWDTPVWDWTQRELRGRGSRQASARQAPSAASHAEGAFISSVSTLRSGADRENHGSLEHTSSASGAPPPVTQSRQSNRDAPLEYALDAHMVLAARSPLLEPARESTTPRCTAAVSPGCQISVLATSFFPSCSPPTTSVPNLLAVMRFMLETSVCPVPARAAQIEHREPQPPSHLARPHPCCPLTPPALSLGEPQRATRAAGELA
ncbi:hypothetical protein FA95DRAFT_1605911 [Auriscalpium vulgare]|uniref:Uncharacterized protein n=1 Tax=Auriscalpium vulgare TaxID=40419 RepID=A0ACB8RUG7_9AGAM|nr:hypothetical protein FA95DRAFT_1605911 [Auriscalpium vulgare]